MRYIFQNNYFSEQSEAVTCSTKRMLFFKLRRMCVPVNFDKTFQSNFFKEHPRKTASEHLWAVSPAFIKWSVRIAKIIKITNIQTLISTKLSLPYHLCMPNFLFLYISRDRRQKQIIFNNVPAWMSLFQWIYNSFDKLVDWFPYDETGSPK